MSNNNKREDVGFIWRITDDVLRDTFKKNEIGDVVLPFVVLRRLDCILEPVNQKVRDAFTRFNDKLSEEKLIPVLCKIWMYHSVGLYVHFHSPLCQPGL